MTDHDGLALVLREHLDVVAELEDPRRANEYHLQLAGAVGPLAGGLEGVDLPAVAVALDDDVEQTEATLGGLTNLAGQQDQACAGAEQRAALGHELRQRLPPARLEAHELEQRRALAAGHDEAGQTGQLRRPPDLHDLGAELCQPRRVQGEVALQRQDTDPG